MTSVVLQGFGSPLFTAAAQSLPAKARALREKTSDVVARLAALEVEFAQRANALADPRLLEDDDTLFADEPKGELSSREPSPRAMLGALGMAASLVLIWMGLQIV